MNFIFVPRHAVTNETWYLRGSNLSVSPSLPPCSSSIPLKCYFAFPHPPPPLTPSSTYITRWQNKTRSAEHCFHKNKSFNLLFPLRCPFYSTYPVIWLNLYKYNIVKKLLSAGTFGGGEGNWNSRAWTGLQLTRDAEKRRTLHITTEPMRGIRFPSSSSWVLRSSGMLCGKEW